MTQFYLGGGWIVFGIYAADQTSQKNEEKTHAVTSPKQETVHAPPNGFFFFFKQYFGMRYSTSATRWSSLGLLPMYFSTNKVRAFFGKHIFPDKF